MGKPFFEIRRARKVHSCCALCMGDIRPGEEYQRMAWSSGPRRMGLTIRLEHASADCLMEMEDEFLREHEPREARVAVAIALEARVVAKVAVDGSTIFETTMIPTTVVVPEPEPTYNDDEEDIPF